MINISVVGCGKWARIIINEISKNKKYNLKSVVCRRDKVSFNNIRIFRSVEDMIKDNSADCIFVAAEPQLNLEVLTLTKSKKTPLILEKPVTDSYKNMQLLKSIVTENNLIVYPNLINFFSETFNEFKKHIEKNISKIKKIIIHEGDFGPFRKNINPIWDWGFHSISLLYLIFKDKEFINVKKMDIKSDNTIRKGNVTKFIFKLNNKIEVNIITGNLFKKKIRKAKVILRNNDYYENDMIYHKLYFNKKIIYTNKVTPISSLLNNFELAVKNKDSSTSFELIEASCKTTKFLEKYYKC
tara:strand:+ start:138 stop:1031 length:894 start_codon:yes stop_codon:yes gene_type:complete